jgi:hypothetical protein
MKAKILLLAIVILTTTIILYASLNSSHYQRGAFEAKQNWSMLPPLFLNVLSLDHGNPFPFTVVVNTTFPEAPDKLMVYRIVPMSQKEGELFASNLARKIMKNAVLHNGSTTPIEKEERYYYYFTNGTHELEVDIRLGWFRYMKRGDWGLLRPQRISEDEAIERAKTVLGKLGLIPPDSVISVSSGLSAVGVSFRVKFGNYTAQTLGVSIAFGEKGEILCIEGLTYSFKPYSEFKIMSPEKAYEILLEYIKYGSPRKGQLICIMSTHYFDKLIINSIKIKYEVGGGYPQRAYIMPTYVFKGLARDPYTGKYELFEAVIDAVDRSS